MTSNYTVEKIASVNSGINPGYADASGMVAEIHTYNYLSEKLTSIINNIVEDDLQKKYQMYLANYRRIETEAIRKAKIFYILNSEHIKYYGIEDYDMDLMGFSYNTDNIFRERFVIPIVDHNNLVIGMTGYDYESDIKYLFAKTAFFDKRNCFYNKQNVADIYTKGTIILCEGIFDSVRLNQVGLINNLALMGSMLFPYQRTILNRIPFKILIPDNDEPGKDALKFWLTLNEKIAVIRLPDSVKDIDDYIKGSFKGAKSRRKASDAANDKTSSYIDGADVESINFETEYEPNRGFLERTKKLNELYEKIINDMQSPFYVNKKEYFLTLS